MGCYFSDFVESLDEPAKKRRFYEPRYPSEVTLDDFIGSPRKAKSVLSMVKDTDRRKSEEIQKYKNQATYLKKKIDTFIDILKDLKKRNLLTTETGNSVMVTYDFN